jgi:hypothetical protein
LHEALCGTLPEDTVKILPDFSAILPEDRLVILKQVGAFFRPDLDVGVAEKGGEIVLGEPWSHSLEVDENGVTIADEDVLRLKVTVDKLPREGGQMLRQALHRSTFKKGGTILFWNPKNIAQTVIHEILLLPPVEPPVEGKLQMEPLDIVVTARDAVKQRDPPKHGLIVRAANIPRLVTRGPEILLSKILKPEKPIPFRDPKHLGNGNAMTGKEICECRVVPVLLLLAEVTDKDCGTAVTRSHPEKVSA